MTPPGWNFASDNVAPAAPEIMAALTAANQGTANSYGADEFTQRLERVARELFETDLAIFPVTTGTAANALALSLLAPPYGAVFCHHDAHILTNECGAPEMYTGGAKLIGVGGGHGKITGDAILPTLAGARNHGVHEAWPAAVSISQATEGGTVYTVDELRALSAFARREKLGFHMDGARFANAVVSLRCTPAEMTWKAGVDVLSLGATKNGAMAAEAVVVFDPARAEELAFRRKRAGHLWSKMRFVSAQLLAYLEDGLWRRNAAQANRMAARMAAGLGQLAGAAITQPVEANELFVTLPRAALDGLRADGFQFHAWPDEGGGDPLIRLVTAFSTEESDVDAFLAAARRHLR